MLYFVLLAAISQIHAAENTLWVWADSEAEAERLRDSSRVVGMFSEFSYIEISRRGYSTISVDFVQKADDWEGSFCTPVLPAAMAKFLSYKHIDLGQIEVLKVTNLATPWMAGCRCYLRLFVSMGFTDINGVLVENDDEILGFCIKNEDTSNIVAHRPLIPKKPISRPPVDFFGAKVIQKAYTYQNVEVYDFSSLILFSDPE